jgi:hypothetical protein
VPLFEAVRELGFSTPEREATITICFAKYLLRTGEPAEARALLEKLAHQLDQIIEAEDVEVYRDLRQHVTLLLASAGVKARGAARLSVAWRDPS